MKICDKDCDCNFTASNYGLSGRVCFNTEECPHDQWVLLPDETIVELNKDMIDSEMNKPCIPITKTELVAICGWCGTKLEGDNDCNCPENRMTPIYKNWKHYIPKDKKQELDERAIDSSPIKVINSDDKPTKPIPIQDEMAGIIGQAYIESSERRFGRSQFEGCSYKTENEKEGQAVDHTKMEALQCIRQALFASY
jgi:hypothetical protein